MNLFLYGTLRAPALAEAVAGRAMNAEPAVLEGYRLRPVKDAITPMTVRAEGHAIEGALWRDVSGDVISRLDLYEGAFGYRLAPVTVRTEAGDEAAQVYLPPSDLEAGQGEWTLEGWREHEDFSVLAARQVFDRDPPLTPEALRTQWPMIQRRAWSETRARSQSHHPAELRTDPASDAARVHDRDPLQGRYFGLQSFRVDHATFDGGRSEVLPREVFVGVEAIMVLPYDPATDRVLLVEQVRMGPVIRGDRNPWTLEAVAGMIDALETPEEAALRETREEAGLEMRHLDHIASFYPSPGSSTDHFHAYLGLCDLPENDRWQGGLDSEHEDLRLHVLPFDRAMALVRSGEVNVGPLIMMLCWLEGRRGTYRGSA